MTGWPSVVESHHWIFKSLNATLMPNYSLSCTQSAEEMDLPNKISLSLSSASSSGHGGRSGAVPVPLSPAALGCDVNGRMRSGGSSSRGLPTFLALFGLSGLSSLGGRADSFTCGTRSILRMGLGRVGIPTGSLCSFSVQCAGELDELLSLPRLSTCSELGVSDWCFFRRARISVSPNWCFGDAMSELMLVLVSTLRVLR
jgi:hypothetical protein